MSGPAPFAFAPLPTTGAVIDGKYVLERLLGQGGMGAVYAARHIKLGHAVAIKLMLADAANHEAASRFVNEGRAAANIQNEHVVRVSDVDEENGYAYMVLELLEGEDLAQILERERRLPPSLAVGYVLQALEGVRQAHAQGIVHRDLKPSNLFLARRQDGSCVIKVLDFGISKANSSNPLGASPGALTSTKALLGSPLYMSPEQLRSSKSVDLRADIWAIGIILYELITGELPFMGENLGELFAQILEVEAPLLRTRVPEVLPGLEAIVARCLQRRPEHRFQNVAELERELAPFAAAPMTSPFAASAVGPSPVVSGTALMSAPSAPPRGPMSSTPGPVTGSVAQAVANGTVRLGASTPQPNRQTDRAWQSTGSLAAAAKGSNATGMLAAALGFVALLGAGFAGYTLTRGRHDGGSSGSGLQASSPPAQERHDLPPAASASASALAQSGSASPSSTASSGVSESPSAAFAGTASAPQTRRPPSASAPVVKALDPRPRPSEASPPVEPAAAPRTDPPKPVQKPTVQQNER